MWQRLRGRRENVRFLGALAALGSAPDVAARELTWKGPAACQQSAYVAEQIEALTGRSLVSIEDYDFSVEVAEGPGPTWELVLVTKPRGAAEQSERRFRGTSCSEVSDAAAVAIAMTLRGDAAEPRPAEPPEPEPAPSLPVARQGVPEPLDERAPSSAKGPLEQAEDAEAARFVERFAAKLDDKKRDVFVLAVVEELSIPEVAQMLSIPLNTAYTRLRIVRAEFRQALARGPG